MLERFIITVLQGQQAIGSGKSLDQIQSILRSRYSMDKSNQDLMTILQQMVYEGRLNFSADQYSYNRMWTIWISN